MKCAARIVVLTADYFTSDEQEMENKAFESEKFFCKKSKST